jgi:Uma2 family endonuclease
MQSALKDDRLYTCEEIDSWDDDNRYELIDGELYMMAPPTRIHQKISGELFRQLSNFLLGKPCEVYPAPFGVKLNKNNKTRVEPDITVVCDKKKLDDAGCNGAPDLIIEILSPSNHRHDRMTKFNKYLQAGVREYWIVDPKEKIVTVNILEKGKYYNKNYDNIDTIPVSVLEGCEIDLKGVFLDE